MGILHIGPLIFGGRRSGGPPPKSSAAGPVEDSQIKDSTLNPRGKLDYSGLDSKHGLPRPGVSGVCPERPVIGSLSFHVVPPLSSPASSASAIALELVSSSSLLGSPKEQIIRRNVDVAGVRGRWVCFKDLSDVLGTPLPPSFSDFWNRIVDKRAYAKMPLLLIAAPQDLNIAALVKPTSQADAVASSGVLTVDLFNLMNQRIGVVLDLAALPSIGPALLSQLQALGDESMIKLLRPIVLINATAEVQSSISTQAGLGLRVETQLDKALNRAVGLGS